MVAFKIQNFGGMVPAVDDALLPDNAATYSQNVWVYSGALRGLRTMRKVYQATSSGVRKAYRIPKDEAKPFDYGAANSLWLEFVDPATDVVKAPVFDDVHRRYYWASDNDRPYYTTYARVAAGQAPFKLGIPAPPTGPSVTVSGGSGATDTRSYVVTWVSAYGEEGQPSPAATVTGFTNGTWNLVLTPPTVDYTTGRNLATQRIYRTVVGTSGATTYFKVADVGIAATSYADTALDDAISLNPILESQTWAEPPDDLEGFVSMPNGILASWRQNEVWFSEPYRPHAWPADYVLTVEYPVVGCGVVGQTLVIATKGVPAFATGVTPAAMTLSKYNTYEPCLARKSIVSAPEGVYYASQNGLVLAIPGQLQNITRNLITRDDWLRDYGVETICSGRLGTAYVAFGTVTPGCFDPTAFNIEAFEQKDYTAAYQGFYLDPQADRIGVNFLSDDKAVVNVDADAWTGDALIVKAGGEVFLIDPPTVNTQTPYVWRSKPFQMPFKENLGALRIFFVPPDDFELNPVPDISLVQTLQDDQYGLVRVYADGRHVFTREMRSSGEVMRLPSGFKADYWQFEVEARVQVREIEIASSVKELRRA